MARITVVINVPGQGDPHRVELVVENYRRGRAAITSGPAENWEPAEGDEFDVFSAYLIRKNKYRILRRTLREKIVEENNDAIIEALDSL